MTATHEAEEESIDVGVPVQDELHADDVVAPKSIGFLGSFALITNNMTGPAMMGLPNVFLQAGYLPSILCILYVCMSSSICGTLLAETIAFIPGNREFTKNIEFSVAFHHYLGDTWYLFVEGLFFMSCMSQACAAIVVTSHTLDGFLASFLFSKTFALQLYPSIEFISWDADTCHISKQSNVKGFSADSSIEDCTPFFSNGPFIISIGFILVTLVFLPLGKGFLKEAVFVQILSFIALLTLLSQFFIEFIRQGLQFSVPMIGDDQSELAGVVLFNFAYIIAVPSWLNEKAPNVSVNKVFFQLNNGYATQICLGHMEFSVSIDEHLYNIFSSSICIILSDQW